MKLILLLILTPFFCYAEGCGENFRELEGKVYFNKSGHMLIEFRNHLYDVIDTQHSFRCTCPNCDEFGCAYNPLDPVDLQDEY